MKYDMGFMLADNHGNRIQRYRFADRAWESCMPASKGNCQLRTSGEVGMIQINMEMPKNCLDCPACNEYLMCAIHCNGRGWGENDVRDFSKGRPEWCPLKEQGSLTQKMWNALYAEEDKLEKQYVGTDKCNDWFTVYRPWLQHGFEIALKVVVTENEEQ